MSLINLNKNRMWGSNVSREQLLQKISLLAMLGPILEEPKGHRLVSRKDKAYSLTVEQEREIITNLAFLSYRRKDSQNVTAICIEEDGDGRGLVVRLAVNGGAIAHVEEGLRRICEMLERASQRRENPETEDIEMFLRDIIILDYSRISTRLKLGRKYAIASSPIFRIHQILHDKSITEIEISKMAALQEKASALLDLYRRVKDLAPAGRGPPACEIIEAMIKLAYGLSQSPALNQISKLSLGERVKLGDVIGKLGEYYKASSELILAARRRRCRLFQRIRVESFQSEVPDDVRLPSKPGSTLPLIKTLRSSAPSSSRLLQPFKGSQPKAATALLRRIDGTRPGIKVHAEIKLLFYYEIHPENATPRLICANKTACYLCDLFFRIHGRFQVPRTFGKLNERWIVPDWLDEISQSRVTVLKGVVEQFDSALDELIGRVVKGIRRLPDPMESAVGLSAYWSSSTLEKGACSGGFHGGGICLPARTELGSSLSDHKAPPLPLEESMSSGSLCSSVLVSSHSASLSSFSRKYDILKSGKSLWKRLADQDQSFIVTFYESHVLLSFNISPGPGSVESGKLWVRVALLGPQERPKGSHDDQSIILLEDIQEDHDVTIKYEISDDSLRLLETGGGFHPIPT